MNDLGGVLLSEDPEAYNRRVWSRLEGTMYDKNAYEKWLANNAL